MRTLVIAGDYPWPTDTGSRLRLMMILKGLLRCGPTELLSVVSKFRTDFGPPDETLGLANVERFGFDNRPASGVGLLGALGRISVPIGLPLRDRHRVEAEVARFVTGRYDLVWYFGARSWVLAGEPAAGPTVVDLIDLEDQKIKARLAEPPPPARPVARARRVGATLVSEEEVRRWQHLHRRAGTGPSTVVVCSELDAERATATGVEHVAVIPNGYPVPARAVGRDTVGTPPTVLFPGLLTYPPNVEAARLLAGEVGPALRALVPGVQIRVVGEHGSKLDDIHDPPSVTVTGRVPDMGDELARADLVVVPLRYGSGTRLKVLEAFAQRIPVVSTSLGAEGLGAVDGVHLLIADSVPEFARACCRLLTERELRRSIVTSARAFVLEQFDSTVIEARVAELARAVAGRSAHGQSA
jgi:glycosyltransferase involved in cell wall biosynthesis